MKCDQTYPRIQQNLQACDLGDLVAQTMDTICDVVGQTIGADNAFAPLALTDPRLLQNNATSMELFRQFQGGSNLSAFFLFIF